MPRSRSPCFVLTVSDTRTEANDTGGQAIRELLERAGHSVSGHAIVKDEASQVARSRSRAAGRSGTQVIITTGGTGISARDTTFEAVTALFEKRLDGFGELFRMISFQRDRIGGDDEPRNGRHCRTQGDLRVARLACCRASRDGKLIVPELGHIVQQLKKGSG